MTTKDRECARQEPAVEPDFAEEYRRQSQVVAAADAIDLDLHGFMEVALADLDDESGA